MSTKLWSLDTILSLLELCLVDSIFLHLFGNVAVKGKLPLIDWESITFSIFNWHKVTWETSIFSISRRYYAWKRLDIFWRSISIISIHEQHLARNSYSTSTEDSRRRRIPSFGSSFPFFYCNYSRVFHGWTGGSSSRTWVHRVFVGSDADTSCFYQPLKVPNQPSLQSRTPAFRLVR